MNIWIKINNKIDNPKEWINQGYISFMFTTSNDHNWLEKSDGKYYSVSLLKPDDCIYVFEVANKTSLLKYRFIISSFYLSKIHGYKIKKVYKCLDIVPQFLNGGNALSRWTGKNGTILNKCINPSNRWKLIKSFNDNQNILAQEVIDNDSCQNHLYLEGKLLHETISHPKYRSITLRDLFIKEKMIPNYKCELCGKSFLKADSNNFIIDVHHMHPIANGKSKNSIKDLKGLCPNCHRFVHSINDFENKTWNEIQLIFNRIYKES